MVDLIQQFSRSVKRAFVGAQIVLIGGLCVAGVPQDLRDLFPAQSRLQQSRCRRAAQTAKAQAVRFAVLNSGGSASGRERTFDNRNAEHARVIVVVATLIFPHRFEFKTQPFANRSVARLHGLCGEGANGDSGLSEVAPAQRKDFAGTHPGIDRADQDCPQMFAFAGAGGKQSDLFVTRQYPRTLALVRDRDQGVTASHGATRYPTFALADIEETAESGEFTVDTSDRSGSAAFCFATQPRESIGLQIRVGDRADSHVAKVSGQRLGVAFDGSGRAKPGDFAIIHIVGRDGVAVKIPLHHVGKARTWAVATGDVKRLAFFQCFAKPVSSLGLVFAGAPECLSSSVFFPRDASIDASVADDDLDFMIAGHLLLTKLYLHELVHDVQSNRETDFDLSGLKNQGYLRGLAVLSCVRQDSDEEVDLTSNQKVPRSSRGECAENLSKPHATPKSYALSSKVLPRDLYLRGTEDRCMPKVKSFLYAVRMCIPGMNPQPVKIGFSTRPEKRRAAYASGPFPCEWLGVWPGTVDHEHAIHRRYAHLAEGLCGEWFIPDEELSNYIATQIAAYQKRLDRYTRFALQRAEWATPVDKETRKRAAVLLELEGDPN